MFITAVCVLFPSTKLRWPKNKSKNSDAWSIQMQPYVIVKLWKYEESA